MLINNNNKLALININDCYILVVYWALPTHTVRIWIVWAFKDYENY